MSYKKHLNEMKPETKDILISLYRNKLISFDVEHTSYVIDPIVVNLLGELIDNVAPSTIITWMLQSEMLANGPKIFEFSAKTLECLEKIELSVNCADYAQPFPVFCVDFPMDYATNRLVQFDESSQDIDLTKKLESANIKYEKHNDANHYPQFGMIKHDAENKLVWIYIHMNSNFSITRFFSLTENTTIENKFLSVRDFIGGNENELSCNEHEKAMCDACIRILCNVAMLATNYGHSEKLDSFKEKLLKKIKNGPLKFVEKNKKLLETRPTFYDLNQEIELFKVSTINSNISGNNNYLMKPHWRSGHWRNQHYGPKNTLTKRIIVPPVFVNIDKFGDDFSKTSVTYKP